MSYRFAIIGCGNIPHETANVVVCTPNGLHAPHAVQALQAECHVLCEKPMALGSGQAREMISSADTAGKSLLVVKQNRRNLPVAFVSNHQLAYRQLIKAFADPPEAVAEAPEGMKTVEMVEQRYSCSPLFHPKKPT